MNNLIDRIISLWAEVNPVAGYTSGRTAELTELFLQTTERLETARTALAELEGDLALIADIDLRDTAAAVLASLETQFALARPSGAGPSGTGMGGVYAAADGVFYIVLKGDASKEFVTVYLDAVLETVDFETRRWWGNDYSVMVRRECLDTAAYLQGALDSLSGLRPDLKDKIQAIRNAAQTYVDLFVVPNLDAPDFATYWLVFKAWEALRPVAPANGYPQCLNGYYQLTETAEAIETVAQGWLDLDIAVTIDIAQRVGDALGLKGTRSLQEVWDAVSALYAVNFDDATIAKVVKACNDFGAEKIIAFTSADRVDFAPTPSYLVSLVTGGEDFADNYLNPATAYSQLYLTAAKNTSMLTMINILVHEASHGFNFVLSAKNAISPLLNLNTSLQVPTTEGMAFYREYQYWAAAQDLVGRSNLTDKEKAYLDLYVVASQPAMVGVLCAQLETYIWRVVRYIRALCDTRVNGGKLKYTDFIEWAAATTGLSEETLHGECFTFMASPGYAPCYAVGGATYAKIQKGGIMRGVSEIDFNTAVSAQGFFAWPVAVAKMSALVAPR